MEAAASPDPASPEAPLYEDEFLRVYPSGIKGKGAQIPLSSVHMAEVKRLHGWNTFFKPLLKFAFALPFIWLECQGPPTDTQISISNRSPGVDKFMFYAGAPLLILWLLVTGYRQFVKGKGYSVVFYGSIGGATRLGDYTKETAKAVITAIQQAQFLEKRQRGKSKE